MYCTILIYVCVCVFRKFTLKKKNNSRSVFRIPDLSNNTSCVKCIKQSSTRVTDDNSICLQIGKFVLVYLFFWLLICGCYRFFFVVVKMCATFRLARVPYFLALAKFVLYFTETEFQSNATNHLNWFMKKK